jgi:hypothetical protein
MRASTRFLRIIGALALAAALAACSAIKLGYSTLDDIGYWWLDGHFDFAGAQETQVRDELQKLHDWHRVNELPRVAQLLARMEQMAAGPVTAAQACALVPDLQARLKAVTERAEPAVADIVLQLTEREIAQLQRKHLEGNRKWARDWMAPLPSKVNDKRFEQWLDRLEMVYGRLQEPQRQVLRAGIDQSHFDAHRIFRERQRRQQDIVQLLTRIGATKPPAAEVRLALRGYVDRALASPEPSYRAYQQTMIEEGCRVFASVHASTTPEQREHAAKRLRGYQQDLKELSASN